MLHKTASQGNLKTLFSSIKAESHEDDKSFQDYSTHNQEKKKNSLLESFNRDKPEIEYTGPEKKNKNEIVYSSSHGDSRSLNFTKSNLSKSKKKSKSPTLNKPHGLKLKQDKNKVSDDIRVKNLDSKAREIVKNMKRHKIANISPKQYDETRKSQNAKKYEYHKKRERERKENEKLRKINANKIKKHQKKSKDLGKELFESQRIPSELLIKHPLSKQKDKKLLRKSTSASTLEFKKKRKFKKVKFEKTQRQKSKGKKNLDIEHCVANQESPMIK